MLRRRLIPDFQTPAVGSDGGPHIFARQAFAYSPRFVEYRNRPVGLDLANKMNAPCSDGQWIRQVSNLRRRQTPLGLAAVRLLRGQVAQHGRGIVRHIPAGKCRTGPHHLPKRSKSASFPEGMPPQTVQLFDFAIVFGFGDRQEDNSTFAA